jgi:uncharacterized membrane protein
MSERTHVTRLLRAVAVFVLIPTFTIGLAMLWDEPSRREHWLHASMFALLAVAAIVVLVQAPRLAARWVKE